MADPNSPTLVSPSDGSIIVGNVIVFTFQVPTDSDNDSLVFRVELDTNNPISAVSSNYKQVESRNSAVVEHGLWYVKNASGVYITMPTYGVDSSFYGRDAKCEIRRQHTTQFPDIETQWYWRIGAGDGMTTNPVYNQVVFGQAIFGGS